MTSPAKGERAFHIFYQLIEGATAEQKKELHLLPAESFKFLSHSGCTSVMGMSDKKEFEGLVEALDTYKIDRCACVLFLRGFVPCLLTGLFVAQ